VFSTYEYYEYSYAMSTMIYRFTFHMNPTVKLIIQTMHGLIMYACTVDISAALELVIRPLHQFFVWMLTFKLIMNACSFDMSAYEFVHNLHQLRSPNNYSTDASIDYV
jgi:hypothetical protein